MSDAPAEPPRSAAIIVNQGAGSARSARVSSTVALARRALDADLHLVATRNREELTEFLAERAGRYRTFVIAGGDGSLSVAFNALRDRDVSLGYIPAGFGNATAHLLRLPRHPAALAGLLVAGDARAIDLVEVDGRLALFVGAGWDATVAARYEAAGRLGLGGWALSVARSLPGVARRWRVRLEADGAVVHEGPLLMAVASVTPFYGRGLRVNPGARPDRGQLTVRAYPGPLARQALESLRWWLGARPAAVPHRATTALLSSLDGRPIPLQADGDPVGERDAWQMVVRPRAVRLIGRW